MEKKVISEIEQMKYLFDYKAGRVISEQIMTAKTDETKFFTDDGEVFRLSVITDLAKKDKFLQPNTVEQTTEFFKVSPQWVQKLRKDLESVKGDKKAMLEISKASPVWNLNNGLRSIMRDVAIQGITPERLNSDPSIKTWMKSQPSWNFIKFATDPENGVITEDQFFRKLAEFIQMRMEEIKS